MNLIKNNISKDYLKDNNLSFNRSEVIIKMSDFGEYEDFDEEAYFDEVDDDLKEELEVDDEDTAQDSRIEVLQDITSGYDKLVKVEGTDRKTVPYLTKFEKTTVLGIRAQQISAGSPVMIDVGKLREPIEMAKKELVEGKCPLIVRRHLPNGTYEDWRLDELLITA